LKKKAGMLVCVGQIMGRQAEVDGVNQEEVRQYNSNNT